MEVTPLYRDPATGQIMEAKPGDVLSLPVNAIVEEFVTLFTDAEVNTCCALIEYTAIPVNSANLPAMNYRKTPAVDCVILEAGVAGQRVKAAITHGKLYGTNISIAYVDSDILYLGRDSKLTTISPSVNAGDIYSVIAGRLVNHNEFVFDPQLPINMTEVGSGLPSIKGNANKYLFTDGNIIEWREVQGGGTTPTFTINSFTSSQTILEAGATVQPTFSMSYSQIPKFVRLRPYEDLWYTVNTPFNTYTLPYTYVLDGVGSKSFTLEATSELDEVTTKDVLIHWYLRKYWGVGTDNIGNPGTFINALQGSSLSSSIPCTINVLASTDQYIYFAIPSSWGTPTFTVGGFSGGFQLISTGIDVTNQYGVTTQYDLWRSDYDNLGQTSVVIT